MNYMVKCTRCRHKMGESQYDWVPDKKSPMDSKTARCPRCGCSSFYHLKADGKPAKSNERHLWVQEPAESEVSP